MMAQLQILGIGRILLWNAGKILLSWTHSLLANVFWQLWSQSVKKVLQPLITGTEKHWIFPALCQKVGV